MKDPQERTSLTYERAGVSIDAQDRALAEIKRLAKSTFTPGVLSDIGSFGGLFALEPENDDGIVLVASADGVGTKLKVAQMAGIHDTVGEDLVNHCVNDILVQGATPLFFLDYLATGKLDPRVATRLVEGIARGCRANRCALIGGETAEMPGFYQPGEYDLAGFIVGAVGRRQLLRRESVQVDDFLVGLPSSGLHTNGYSLARRVFFDVLALGVESHLPELGHTVGEELLAVHRSYLPAVGPLIEAGFVRSAAHITGGGIPDNLPRALPDQMGAEVFVSSWVEPPVFRLIRAVARVPEDDMRRTFNLGVGIILVVAPDDLASVLELLAPHGPAWVVGRIVPGVGVRFLGGSA